MDTVGRGGVRGPVSAGPTLMGLASGTLLAANRRASPSLRLLRRRAGASDAPARWCGWRGARPVNQADGTCMAEGSAYQNWSEARGLLRKQALGPHANLDITPHPAETLP